MKRFHVHMHVDDLSKNITFYSAMFNQPPARTEGDYAKWMLEDPPVNFAISTRGSKPGVDHLGIQVDSLADGPHVDSVTGWVESQRATLQTMIAQRQPFLDFLFSRENRDGSQQHFRVSGEPMFNQACQFLGYRGIGIEVMGRL